MEFIITTHLTKIAKNYYHAKGFALLPRESFRVVRLKQIYNNYIIQQAFFPAIIPGTAIDIIFRLEEKPHHSSLRYFNASIGESCKLNEFTSTM